MATHLFIDTNIWLDFYRSNNEAGLSLLKRVKDVARFIIITDQIIMEFGKNRQEEILKSVKNLVPPNPLAMPAFLSSEDAMELRKTYKKAKTLITQIKERLPHILEDPGVHDPVYQICHEVFTKKEGPRYGQAHTVSKEVLEAALKRFQLGYPPRKPNDTSIGDAVNWEWIIHCARTMESNIAIVSRDYDCGQSYDQKGYLRDYLKREFADRVGKGRKISLFPKLTEVLKTFHVTVTKKEKEEEDRLIQSFPFSKASDIYTSYYTNLAATPLALADVVQQYAKRLAEQQAAIAQAIGRGDQEEPKVND